MTNALVAERVAKENRRQTAEHQADLDHVRAVLSRRGIEADRVIAQLREFSVAAPSWALAAGATRFGRFAFAGEPRTVEEKVDDIAALNVLTGANRTISLHIPWDEPAEPAVLRTYAAERGLTFDCMNSNTFQDNPSTTRDGAVSYKFGSLCHTDSDVRAAAIEHNRHVIDVGVELGSTALLVWLADGTNHPGQASFRAQFERTLEALSATYAHLPPEWRLYTEHKPYEPAFYSSVNPDWGTSLLLAQGLGERAQCVVDLGHHLPNTNIEQVVSRLAMTGRLGGFHLNDSNYGDDDLTVGSVHPFQLFLVFCELVNLGQGSLPSIAYMIDQSHNLKDPIEDLIQATVNTQLALAQALCVDRTALAEAQTTNDPTLAEEELHWAFRTDLRPLVAEARHQNKAAIHPLATFRACGYREAKVAERTASSE